MAIPTQLSYENEDDFTQRMLIPLLQRLGFSLVVNYHGASELGKDLIFAEIDRFGHIRYHGLQAKYVPSISLNDTEELIADCRQAFANPFTHPQTGTNERISGFYVATGGSLGADAVNHFFNSLRPAYGANVQLLQGKDLVTLDRWASVNQVGSVRERINGLLLELRYNEFIVGAIREALEEGEKRPLERLRLQATSAYLTSPLLGGHIRTAEIGQYWHYCETCNNALDFTGLPGIKVENRKELTNVVLTTIIPNVTQLKTSIESSLVLTLKALGPLTPI